MGTIPSCIHLWWQSSMNVQLRDLRLESQLKMAMQDVANLDNHVLLMTRLFDIEVMVS